MSSKHEFALHYADLAPVKSGTLVTISDPTLVHRMVTVLRLQKEDELILFDREQHVAVQIVVVGKKQLQIKLGDLQKNKILTPTITVLLPLLKREAFADAIYSCVELGANNIQLVTTSKTHKNWTGNKELEHAHKVMIAAAEQSKNFAYPQLQSPMALQELGSSPHSYFFDPAGLPMQEILKNRFTQGDEITLMIGPEGDLTPQEKELLKSKGFIFCALTPTVLRAQQALALGLGAFRSWLK